MPEKQTGLEHNTTRVDRSRRVRIASSQVNDDDNEEQYFDVLV